MKPTIKNIKLDYGFELEEEDPINRNTRRQE